MIGIWGRASCYCCKYNLVDLRMKSYLLEDTNECDLGVVIWDYNLFRLYSLTNFKFYFKIY